MSTDFAEYAATKGAIVISPDEAKIVSLSGRFNRHGENFTSNLFDALAAGNRAEFVGLVAEHDFTKVVDWEKEGLKPIGSNSRKMLVTLKAADSPIVIPAAFSHLFFMIQTAANIHFSNTALVANRTYIELLYGQGYLQPGEQTFANKGIHVDTSASAAMSGGLRNEDVFICSHSTPFGSGCTTVFYDGPIHIGQEKYNLMINGRPIRGKLKEAVDESFRKDIADCLKDRKPHQSAPLEIWRFPPTLAHGQMPVTAPVFRTAAVVAFFESDDRKIHNNNVLKKYFCQRPLFL